MESANILIKPWEEKMEIFLEVIRGSLLFIGHKSETNYSHIYISVKLKMVSI